jgi:hypothetical protein
MARDFGYESLMILSCRRSLTEPNKLAGPVSTGVPVEEVGAPVSKIRRNLGTVTTMMIMTVLLLRLARVWVLKESRLVACFRLIVRSVPQNVYYLVV